MQQPDIAWPLAEEVLVGTARRILAAQLSDQIYPEHHPHSTSALGELHEYLGDVGTRDGEIRIALVDEDFVVGDVVVPAEGELLHSFAELLRGLGIGRLTIDGELERHEVLAFIRALNGQSEALEFEDTLEAAGIVNIRAGALRGRGGRGALPGAAATDAWTAYSVCLQMAQALKAEVAEGAAVDVGKAHDMATALSSLAAQESDGFEMLSALLTHDAYSYTHSVNVAVMSLSFARWLGLPGDRLVEVAMAAILHDVGKVSVPDAVLNKPGKLDDAEWAIMQRHNADGARMLLDADGSDLAFVVAYEHQLAYEPDNPDHCRWPLHMVSQLVCIADVYDALRSNRPYRDALPPDVAMEIMDEEADKKFDRDLFDAFRRMTGYYPTGACLRLSDDRVAVSLRSSPVDVRRPEVLIVRDAQGQPVEPPEALELAATEAVAVAAVLDPDAVGIDPLDYL